MKLNLFLVLGLFLLPSCVNSPGIATLSADCKDAGQTQSASLEETSRGYSYRFQIHLPPCFDPASENPYPVLYLIPGRGSSSDAWFSAGVGKIVDELILDREIPPFILVVTQDTNSDPYASVIVQDLMPHIKEHYPIHPERRYQAVAGGSLGGIAAYRIVFANPEQFSSAAMFGSGVISGEEKQVRTWLEQMQPATKPRVFLNCGTEDVLMLERAEIMTKLLYEHEISHVLHVGQGDHSYTYWASMFPTYLRWLAEDWQ